MISRFIVIYQSHQVTHSSLSIALKSDIYRYCVNRQCEMMINSVIYKYLVLVVQEHRICYVCYNSQCLCVMNMIIIVCAHRFDAMHVHVY